VLQWRVCGRAQLTKGDRLFLVELYRWFPSVLKAITIIRPETVVRGIGPGLRRYWCWKSRSLGGRPQIEAARADPADERGQSAEGSAPLYTEAPTCP
jgi:hypothetical protein